MLDKLKEVAQKVDSSGPHPIVELSNGRLYKIVETNNIYVDGEYPSGGIIVTTHIESPRGNVWVYLDNCRDVDGLIGYLKLMGKNKGQTPESQSKSL
jgi:hypothetical protein